MGMPESAFAPGEGPAAQVSVSLRAGNSRAGKGRGGARDFRVVVSAITPVEAQDVRVNADRLRWFLSRLRVEPVSEETSMTAIDLLRVARLHGHKYAIDAIVAATALRAVKPVIVLTSDED